MQSYAVFLTFRLMFSFSRLLPHKLSLQSLSVVPENQTPAGLRAVYRLKKKLLPASASAPASEPVAAANHFYVHVADSHNARTASAMCSVELLWQNL